MYSLAIITIFLLVSLCLFGLTKSISNLHYEYFEKYGFWGYGIFPATMLLWATLVANESPELIPAVIGIYYVGIFAMFEDKQRRYVGVVHYLGAVFAIAVSMYFIWLWCLWVVLAFVGLSVIALFSDYKIYIIEMLAIIAIYLYKFNAF